MTRACALVVEARGSLSRGFSDCSFAVVPVVVWPSACSAFRAARSAALAARSPSLRASCYWRSWSSLVTSSASRTRRPRSSAARRGAAVFLRLAAPGLASTFARRSCSAFFALARHSSEVECRRSDAAPPRPAPACLLSNPIQAGHARPHQCDEAVDQQPLRHVTMIDPKPRQRLGVHFHLTA